MHDSATAGFKYFDCKGVKRVKIKVRGYCRGHFEVKTAWDGKCSVRFMLNSPISGENIQETLPYQMESMHCILPSAPRACHPGFIYSGIAFGARGQRLMRTKLSEFELDMVLVYETDPHSSNVGLLMIPKHFRGFIAEQKNYRIDSLVQLKILGDNYPDGFSQGLTMRNSASTFGLKYEKQYCIDTEGQRTIVTVLRNNYGHQIEHHAIVDARGSGGLVQSKYVNSGLSSIFVEMLSAFPWGNYSLCE